MTSQRTHNRAEAAHPGARLGTNPGAGATVAPGSQLRVAGVDPELGFGGGETQVLGLTRELTADGHRAELICDPAGRLWERARALGIVCHALRIRNALDVAAAMRLRAMLARERYDVVHFHTSRAHSMAPFADSYARALVVTRRMDYRPNRLFAPYLFGRAVDGVAAISRGVADALGAAGVARSRVTIIPSGVDCAHFRPPSPSERAAARAALGVCDGEIAVGTLGALEARKGHRDLLAALAALTAREPAAPAPSLVCMIAGDGSLRDELARDASRLGIAERLRMLGRIDDSRALLWALDVFAFPSLKEGLGVAMLEAMACGLAVVASRTGGIGDVVDDGRTGLLVAPGDAGALASALGRLAEDGAARAALGAAARTSVAETFSMAAMARRTLELYRSCLAANRGAGSHSGRT